MPKGRLEIRWSAPNIGAGLEEEIVVWLDAHPDAVLVAIDTLGKVRPRSDGRRNAYDVDVADMARLQDLFRNRAVGLLIVHHMRKEGSDDFLTAVSGTYGITGSADTTAAIRRKRNESFGSVFITGRDVADAEISVRFDGLTWHEAPKVVSVASMERQEIYEIVRDRGPIFPAAIAKELGDTGRRRSIDNMCRSLADEGVFARVSGGFIVPSVTITKIDGSGGSEQMAPGGSNGSPAGASPGTPSIPDGSNGSNGSNGSLEPSEVLGGHARARGLGGADQPEPSGEPSRATDVGQRWLHLVQGESA